MPANNSNSSEVTKMEDSGSPVRVKRRKPGPPPTFSPSVRKQRRRDQAKTRVRLLDTFGEWRSLQKKLHLKTDRDLARTLLDGYPCVDVGSQSTHKTLPSADVVNQSTHKSLPSADIGSQSTHKTLSSADVGSQSTHKSLPSADIGSQSTHKTLQLERGLLCTWNNIMASRGFNDDMEFLWFLLTTATESRGLPAVRSKTSTVQGVAHKTTQKRTNSRDCVPVKVDYVGPSRMTTGTSHTENPEPAVPTLTYHHPSRTKNSNSAAIGPVASNIHVSVPEEEHCLHPNNGLSDTDTASEFELHSEGIHVKEEEERETDLGSCANTSTSQPSFVAADHDSTDEQETNVGNHDTTSPHQTSPVSSDTVDELLETDLHTSQLSFGADVKEEDEAEMTLRDGDNNQVTSQLCTGGPDVDGEDEQEKDDGNSGDTSATFACGTDDTEAEEENILGDGDILEDNEVESASSEDDEKGHQSDDSWHPPSERRKTIKNSKESSKRKTKSPELSCETERESRPTKTWVCECEETFESQSLLYKHKEAVHPKFCEICDKRFPTITALNKCRRSHMSPEDRANLEDSLAFCALCRGFFSKRRPKRHFQVPQDGQQRPDRCQESMPYRDDDFVGGKPVIKKRRKQRKLGDSVSEKRRRMSKDVPCTWEGCQKTFKWNAEMRAHLVHHTGERSHLCSYCGQMFLRNDHLTVHMRIHTGDMPFKCSLCNYSGRQSNCLRWHMKTHHPEHCQQAGSGKGAQPTRKEDVLGTSEMLNDLMDDGETSPSGDNKGVEPTGDMGKEEDVFGTSEMPDDSMEDGENSPSGDYKGVEPTGDMGKEEDVFGTSEMPDDLMDDGETSPSGDYKGVEPTGVVGKEEDVLGTSEMPDDSMEDGENSPSVDYKGVEPIKDMDTEEQVLETFEKPE